MTLAKCQDCGREVSNAASACPHCGKPRVHVGAAIITALVMGAGVWWLWRWIMG
jgi:uncharacterized OB-fold protein